MADNPVPQYPYVGPRAIERGQAFYGRDKEIRSLSALLVSERIVLLHSPSGAGKSSLIQAGLTERMEERFSVLPQVRVNAEVPDELRTATGVNRYLLSTLLSLEEGLPVEARTPRPELAALTLDAYLSQRPRDADKPLNDLLIFDQFEEVLTASLTDGEAKQQFFEQLGEALQNRRRWALFAIREDYIGGLAPYVRAIPNRLATTFRLGMLGPDAAKLAIQQPAKNAQVDFTDQAADKLVDDLRRIQMQQADGSFVTEAGPDIEPVQLQVVCYRLWQTRPAGKNTITADDLAAMGDVNQAISDYYTDCMEKAAQRTGVTERQIRDWFDKKLLTPEGLRNLVLMRQSSSDGLDNQVIRLLESDHLVRAEKRGGTTWFELAHDRLVAPVRASNTEWLAKNLGLLQRQAVVWDKQGRSEGLLLHGKELTQAEKESESLELTQDENAFLEACRVLQKRERQSQRMTTLAISTTLALVVILLVAFPLRWAYFATLRQQVILSSLQVRLDGGTIIFGTNDPNRFPEEPAMQNIKVETFAMDSYEVTNQNYRICVEVGACDKPKNTGLYDDMTQAPNPVSYVTFEQAQTYCAWLGRRLPTTFEWERAARGLNGKLWPWGDEPPTQLRANLIIPPTSESGNFYNPTRTLPVGVLPLGAAAYSAGFIFDLAGNVWEWTSTNTAGSQDSSNVAQSGYIQRGGSWQSQLDRITSPIISVPDHATEDTGFRCAQ